MKIKHSTTASDTPNAFISQHSESVIGVLSGFDRVRLLASLRPLYAPKMMMRYLSRTSVLLKDFASFATNWTERVRQACVQLAEETGRPIAYLNSSSIRKESLARELAGRDGIKEGLIGIWSCVEPCLTYFVRRDRSKKQLDLRLEPGKCLHYYFYQEHPTFGLMHLRLQTWFPFQVSVCINGRHWLARQMDRAGVAYQQRENCFTWIEDVAKAQALAAEQLQSHWPSLLQPVLEKVHPLSADLCRPLALSYYWSVNESEYATDVMFNKAADLARLYPTLVHHGIKHFGSVDVLRFLGHKAPICGRVHANFKGEILSELKSRPEGLRLKHQANGNSLKLYDKQGSVLRVETTLNRPHQFRVYRPSERDPKGRLKWQVLRKGTADLHRRAEVCHAANHRYLEALGSVSSATPLSEMTLTLCGSITKDGRRYRGLNPWSEKDGRLLQAISKGDWAINGFRNRDLRSLLFPGQTLQKNQAAKITRSLSLLRAHGLIKKVSGTHRYLLTSEGRRITTALLAARNANVDKLTSLAA